jgi:hypothetical protein
MDSEELKEIMELLEQQGWKPLLCDTPVPFYNNPVKCGQPADIGDVDGEIRMMPKEFLAMQPEFVVTVQGDSMTGAGIIEGDAVKVVTNQQVHDGDIVLVMIDGDFTLKTYCEDEDGAPWLVPQNEAYDAFPLKEQQNVWVLGVAKEVIKRAPRISYRSCMKQIGEAKAKLKESLEISPLQVSRAIREIAQLIEIARQWYAVYRVLADLNVVPEDDFDGFIEMVTDEVPHHKALPTRAEMQRMAVQSFAKPVALWRAGNAPVQGKRYNDYLKIAQQMMRLLGV